MSFPRYPEYRDSGIGWLGDVPKHWDVQPLKRVCSVFPSNVDKKSYEGEQPVRLCNYTDVYYNDTINSEMPFMGATATSEQVEKFTLRAGDSIITKDSETADDIAISAYVPSDLPGVVCGYHLSMIRPTSLVEGLFVKQLFDSAYVKACCHVSANGLTRVGLGQYALDNLVMPLPPKGEQRIIAAFIDREAAKIDSLIAEQVQLIALLKEKRQAVISHAVTKGLNPDVPMKNSEIEWLGEVPEHWERVQVGRVCRQVSDGPHFSPSYVDDGVMFLSARNISVDAWQLEDAKFVSEEDYREFCKRVVPEIGDVLYTKGGTTGIARVVDLNDRFQVWVHVAVLKLYHDLVDSHFMAYALNSIGCYEQSQLHTRGATNQDLGLTRMTKIWFALPPQAEQLDIVAFLHAETRRIDQLSAEAGNAKSLLLERRSALISAAVTGKIDVRKAA